MDSRPLCIGPFRLAGRALLAPMAGVTDLPFRRLCRRMGAALAASEMLSADARLWDTDLSRRRRDHTDEPSPRVVQIAGGDPLTMADAARRNVDAGAEIIDINMGCPAKKVCNRDAGSALLRDERLVGAILDAVMIGRAAQGRPWLFREIEARLKGAPDQVTPSLGEQRDIMLHHLRDLHAFYGEGSGVRIARKHVGWYCRERPDVSAFRQAVMQAETAEQQLALIAEHFGTERSMATAA